MSYILDALRRAEAQRQQQNPLPPGLGSAPLPAPPAAPQPAAASMASATATTADALTRSAAPAPDAARAGGVSVRQLGWVMLLVIATAGVLLMWARQGQPPAADPAAPTGQAAPATPTAPVMPLPSLPAEPAAPILQPAPPPPPPTAVAAPVAPVAPAVRAAARKQPGEVIPRYAELPEAVRAGLPAISVQGVTWSENAALRHLIVNGRVLQEGQSIGPDHVLEQIGREGSVLSYRGQRYRIGH
ncbi:general secretion pathway protein GspB [uncultured Hydrogenophaga sp.]|uniref:general secretion pathway protein GspB n=1 Tax=uncultured Hydrogenophaga sp. TaxID=199683 RepID=UPI00265DB142|nr:general secretion pathway protein GspB [uncultured Hydrogenophaga sp.]